MVFSQGNTDIIGQFGGLQSSNIGSVTFKNFPADIRGD